eukprot:m.221268 g.221268  ORF g.221268 m.221268 type:complete len:730 (-) comp33344_c0_seq1:30-2219(-)
MISNCHRSCVHMAILALASSIPSSFACGSNGIFQVVDQTGACFAYDFSALPIRTFMVNDSIPEPYLVTTPCAAADTATCSACTSQTEHAPGFQLMPGTGCSGDRCFAIGNSALEPMMSGTDQGLLLKFTGGDDGRAFMYNLSCDPNIPVASSIPTLIVENPRFTYVVTWPSSAGCGKVTKDCTAPPTPPPPPLATPTTAQMAWMGDEMGAIGHFNMGTFHACGIGEQILEGVRSPSQLHAPRIDLPPANAFAPTDVQTDEWVAALASVGVKRAVLVVSHGCGFNTFPSRTAFPEFGFVYNYTIAQSPWLNGKGDIAADFIKSCKKYGIRPGFYHGAMNNAYLNVVTGVVQPHTIPGQPSITQAQYTQILLANLRQIWTDYGDLAEVWFDGGYPAGTQGLITDLLKELQPNAVAFQGPGANIIRWCGTEGGHVSAPFWSAAASSLTAGKGDPFGAVWSPGEADTCFQSACDEDGNGGSSSDLPGPYGGCWFYNSGDCPKKLSELVSSYHDTIGTNAFMLLDWTPTQSGRMRADHLQRYTEFGDFLKTCYSTPKASVANITINTSVSVDITNIVDVVDRISIREDQRTGQRIMGFEVWGLIDNTWQQLLTGPSIGNRYIGVFPNPVKPTSIRVNFTNVIGTTALTEVTLFNCTRVPNAATCELQKNFAYKIVPGITLGNSTVSGTSECCSLCLQNKECAQFVLSPSNVCTRLSANQGGGPDQGFVSGAPNR